MDVPADSDYVTGFFAGGYNPGTWHADAASQPVQRGSRQRHAAAGEHDRLEAALRRGGRIGGRRRVARARIGRHAGVLPDVQRGRRRVAPAERLTTEQTTPSRSAPCRASGRAASGRRRVLVGAEGRWTTATVEEIRYSVTNVRTGPFFAGGTESIGAVFGRVSFVPHAGADDRGRRCAATSGSPTPDDAALPTHSANFFSPRAVGGVAAHRTRRRSTAAVYRAHRTPTLNELHRGFRVGNIVTNPNPRSTRRR